MSDDSSLAWRYIKDQPIASASVDRVTGDYSSTLLAQPVEYPSYVAAGVISGGLIALVGLVLTLAFVQVWPAVILAVGLAILWVSILLARRIESRPNVITELTIWQTDQGTTSTNLSNLPLQRGRMSATA